MAEYKDKEKRKAYQRGWVAARRESFFSGKTCVWCGSTENLELDHEDPSQKVSHRAIGSSLGLRNAWT